MTVSGSDIPAGPEVKWYAGATLASESLTLAAGDITAGYKALGKKAEYGSVIVSKGGVKVDFTEVAADGTTAATEANGTHAIKFSGLTASDVYPWPRLSLHYSLSRPSPFYQIS